MNKIYGEYYPKKYLQNPIRDFHNNLLSHFIGETHVARVILLFKIFKKKHISFHLEISVLRSQ